MVVRILLTGVLVTGCAVFDNPPLRPELDLSPVDCRYKWIQSGYSPDLAKGCDAPREHLREEQTLLAEKNAWDIAGQRCPVSCPPRELQDPSQWRNPTPDGVCRDGVVYFHTRVFFQCGGR